MASPLPNRLISAAKVAGTAVYDTHGEKLGHIDDVMIDKASGRIAYAVLAFGGFMGFNDRHHPLPWSALRYDTTREGYVIDIDRAKLAAGPAALRPLKPDWSDQGWGQVDDYYGTRAGDGDVPLDATIPRALNPAMRLGIAGVNGRMGRLLIPAIHEAGATLVGGIDPAGAPDGVRLFPDIAALAAACDAVLDFSTAATALPHAAALSAARTAWVLGTTGLDDAATAALTQAATRIAIVQAANFSPGVTLLLALAERLGAALPADTYDAEILELHHRHKIDAPSGTALALGQAVAAGRGTAMHRRPHAEPREIGQIGFATQRGGEIVGEHTLSFTASAEQITLSHRAFDRAAFAEGAVRAALWLSARPPGRYGMVQVMGM